MNAATATRISEQNYHTMNSTEKPDLDLPGDVKSKQPNTTELPTYELDRI